jgi:hypothetical protein
MKREATAGGVSATSINATPVSSTSLKINPLKPLKKDERGIVYDCGGMMYVERKKGTITADHIHPEGEIIYLLKGRLELTIGKASKIVESPARFTVPANIYHKLVALSDIVFLKSQFS